MPIKKHGKEQSLEARAREGGGGGSIRVSISCCSTTTEIKKVLKTVIFHNLVVLSMAEAALPGSGSGTGQLYASLFILSRSVQLRQPGGCTSLINRAAPCCSNAVSQDVPSSSDKTLQDGWLLPRFQSEKNEDKWPFEDLGGILLTECKHLWNRFTWESICSL